MKPVTKKAILSSAVLTLGFSLVLFLGPLFPGNAGLTRIIDSTLVIGLSIVAAALVWAAGPSGPDDRGER